MQEAINNSTKFRLNKLLGELQLFQSPITENLSLKFTHTNFTSKIN